MFKEVLLKIFKTIRGRTHKHIRQQVNCRHQWYGNTYGGFYLNPDFIQNGAIVYSFGIGEDISFDLDLIKEHDCVVYGFDPTPKSIQWCAEQDLPENFHLYPFGIGPCSGNVIFNLPKNPEHVSGSVIAHKNVDRKRNVEVEMKSFANIQNLLRHEKIDILKMDIEGSEYEVVESILQSKIDITQIVIELHERFFKNGKEKSIKLIEILNQNGYQIFAYSNSYEEVSFIKREQL